MKRHMKKWIGALLLSLAFLPSVSWAQWAVTVVNCIPTSGAIGIGCASEATAAAQYTYLSTGINTSIMGVGGALGLTDGVIELLRKANDETAKGVEGQRQDMPNGDLADRQRDYSLKQRETVERYYGGIGASACRESTVSSSMSGGASGGGAGGTAGKEGEIRDIEEARYTDPRSANTSLTELVTGQNPNYCSTLDQKNKYPGCQKSFGGGTMPGANITSQTLIQPASGASNPATNNFSIPNEGDSEDRIAALNFIKMNSPRPAPDIPEKAKDTTMGKQYLVYQKRYNSRSLAASGVFSGMLAFSTQPKAGENATLERVWKIIEPDYKETYPGRKIPTLPSERELMYFLVDRQYSKKIIDEDAAQKENPNYLAARNLELQKMNAYLMVKLHQQMERQNEISAFQLSNDMDPVNYQDAVKYSQDGSGLKSQ